MKARTNSGISLLLLAVVLASSWTTLAHAQSKCPAADEPCMNERNFARCKRLEGNGCQTINILESCPLQFSCANFAPMVRAPAKAPVKAPVKAPAKTPVKVPVKTPVRPGRTPVKAPVKAPAQAAVRPRPVPTRPSSNAKVPPTPTAVKVPAPWDPCPPSDDECMNEKLAAECQAVANTGCKNIIALLSCPYAGFGCAE